MNTLKEVYKSNKVVIKLLFWGIFIIFLLCLTILQASREIKTKNNDLENEIKYEKKILNLYYNKLKVNYKINEYSIEGIIENNVFTGNLTYTNGSNYRIKYENGNLTREDDNDDFIVLSINSKYLMPAYILGQFNENIPSNISDNILNYKIDDISYTLKIIDDGHYIININENGEESILNYQKIE